MIDYVEEVIPGKFANGYKDLKRLVLKCIGQRSNMPGMLQIALVQMAALTILTMPENKGKLFILFLQIILNLKRKLYQVIAVN